MKCKNFHNMEYTMSHFQDEALILLNNRFANRIQSVDIVEQSLLLDGLLNGLQQKKIMNEIAMKGGGALQRGYDSERFSSDLDFACGKYPPFTAKDFYQFGQDFCSDFKKIVHDTFDIQPDKVSIFPPEDSVYNAILKEKRIVASWTIRVEIPAHMSLLNRERQRSPRNDKNYRKDIQYVKIDICNVPTYLDKNYRSLISSSSKNTVFAEGYVQKSEEIFYEKMSSLLLRRTFKPYDIYDMFFAEQVSDLNIQNIDRDVLLNKIRDQNVEGLVKQIKANKNFVLPIKKNKFDFLNSLQNLLTYDGYKSIYCNVDNIMKYAENRFDYCSSILFNKDDSIPLDISLFVKQDANEDDVNIRASQMP